MRKGRENYKEFLANSIHFLNNILMDINVLACSPRAGRNMHVVFHDILDVELTVEKPYVKTRLLWENFYHIATVKSEYNVSIKVKECVLKVGSRKEPLDMGNLIDTAIEMVKNNMSDK